MPYKRPGSPYYQVRRRRLPAYGDSGVLSTKTKSKAVAVKMEALLDELAQKALIEPRWRQLLEAIVSHQVELPTLLASKNQGRLGDLLKGLSDPPLAEVLKSFRAIILQGAGEKERRTERMGLDMIAQYAPAAARLSYLREAKSITLMCHLAEADGRLRNSVRRTMLRAISLLLRHEVGNAERNAIFADVRYAAEDDTREVHLSPDEIGKLLGACVEYGYYELRTIIRMALATSADRGVLLSGPTPNGEAQGMLVRQLRIYMDNETELYSGEVFLDDTKAKDRQRTVPLTDSLCRELLPYVRGKGPDDQVFNMRYPDLDFPWQRVREKAGLKDLRFKDLRSQTAIYAEEAGVPLTVASRTLGHSDEKMTRRYQKRKAYMKHDEALRIEEAMLGGLGPVTRIAS